MSFDIEAFAKKAREDYETRILKAGDGYITIGDKNFTYVSRVHISRSFPDKKITATIVFDADELRGVHPFVSYSSLLDEKFDIYGAWINDRGHWTAWEMHECEMLSCHDVINSSPNYWSENADKPALESCIQISVGRYVVPGKSTEFKKAMG